MEAVCANLVTGEWMRRCFFPMLTLGRGIAVSFLLAAVATEGQGAPILLDGSFEGKKLGTGYFAFEYQPDGTGWTFSGSSGIQADNSAWSGPLLCGCGTGQLGPYAPNGSQTAFLQSSNDVLSFFFQEFVATENSGALQLFFSLAQRTNYGLGDPLTLDVFLDSSLLGSFTASDIFVHHALAIGGLAAGNHKLSFVSTSSAADSAALIDNIYFGDSVEPRPVPTPSSLSLFLFGVGIAVITRMRVAWRSVLGL